MELIIATLVIAFMVVMGFKAYQGYGSYRGTLYQELFGSYLEYFWKLTMKEDLSKSSYLESRIGPHRITYNAYFDAQGKRAATFTTVFSTRGHLSIDTLSTTGTVTGGDTGAWRVERDGKQYALSSPLTYLKRQKRFFDSFMKGAPVEYVVAVGKGADTQGVTCSYRVMKAADVVEYLAGMPEGTVREGDMLKAFESFKEMAQHAK